MIESDINYNNYVKHIEYKNNRPEVHVIVTGNGESWAVLIVERMKSRMSSHDYIMINDTLFTTHQSHMTYYQLCNFLRYIKLPFKVVYHERDYCEAMYDYRIDKDPKHLDITINTYDIMINMIYKGAKI